MSAVEDCIRTLVHAQPREAEAAFGGRNWLDRQTLNKGHKLPPGEESRGQMTD